MKRLASHPYKPDWLEELSRYCYSFLLALLVPVAILIISLKGTTRRLHYNKARFERLGFVSRPTKTGGYLFHCVSVGEVVAASCLIKQLQQQEPDTPITITTTTPTGSARVRAIFADSVHHFFLPYDLHTIMATMLKRIQPKAVLITEVELWPNLIHACWKRHIPVVIVNARMTDSSAKRYGKIPKLFQPMLNKLSHICAQGERDFQNYLRLGAQREKITLTNNVKFDQAAQSVKSSSQFKGIEKNHTPILVAGSTHEGEEAALIQAVNVLWDTYPELRLIIVPRHPQRFEAVATLLEESHEPYVRTSQVEHIPASRRLVLVDEMGQLNQAYEVATMAFVGGSLADKGGHNALEPAAQSVPIMMGPHTYNNPIICDYLQQCGALTIVRSAADIQTTARHWLANPDMAKTAGIAGRQVLDDNQGAVEKTLASVSACLNTH